ncbi:MAG: CAP domain-containing protein [Candidatus Bipolaricaulia bacterium]
MQTPIPSRHRLFLLFVTAVPMALAIAAVPVQAEQSTPEATFLSLINDYRADSDQCWSGERWRSWPNDATRSLTRSSTLDDAANAHNSTMAEADCLAHRCEGEADLPERIEAAGYPPTWNYLAENIAGGFETAQAVMEAWRNSDSHHRTMLDCRVRAIGIARTEAPQSDYRWFWTTDFGDVVDAAQRADSSTNPNPVLTTLKDYDVNDNDRIDRPEFNDIVSDWNAGRLSDRVVEKAYDLYRSGGSLSGAGMSAPFSVAQDAGRARFAVNGLAAHELTVRIYGLSGDIVYTGRTSDTELVWHLQNQRGQPVARGVYLYVVEADTSNGLKRRVGRMTVLP